MNKRRRWKAKAKRKAEKRAKMTALAISEFANTMSEIFSVDHGVTWIGDKVIVSPRSAEDIAPAS